MALTVASLVAAAGAITVGAVLQAATGMGTGILIVPLLALIELKLVPGPVVLASIAVSLPMAWQGREQLAWEELRPLMAGIAAGCMVGALGLRTIPADRVGIVFAGVILAMVALTASGLRLPFNRRSLGSVGVVAGMMGAASGAGAPPIALLYQHRSGPQLRPTLGFVYTASSVIIVFWLAMVGRFGWQELTLAALLVPGYVLGFLAAKPLARRLDQGWTRVAILVISGGSAVILLIRSL
jgi:hypothetical protein